MMNLAKIAIVGASILTLGTLTACQSTNMTKDSDRPEKMHGGKPERKATPEQREQMKKMHAERHESMKQMKTACDGKTVGTAVQIKMGDKTIDGLCNMTFKADAKEMKKYRGEHPSMQQPMRGDFRGGMDMKRGEPLTDAQRAELTKQFDQRLAQRQAQQKAIAQACQGKTTETAIQIKLGEQTINGKCVVRFQPKPQVVPTTAPVKVA